MPLPGNLGITLLLPSRASLSTPVTPVAIPSPATHPAATVTTAGSTLWTLWSQSKTPSPRVAPVTAALIPPSTPPAPAACRWPRHLGQPSHTSLQELLAFVGVGARLLAGPTMQTGGGRSHPPLRLLARARATDRSCTTQAPAPPQGWPGAAVTHQGSPGKALLLIRAPQEVLTPFCFPHSLDGRVPSLETCSQMYGLTQKFIHRIRRLISTPCCPSLSLQESSRKRET